MISRETETDTSAQVAAKYRVRPCPGASTAAADQWSQDLCCPRETSHRVQQRASMLAFLKMIV